LFGAQILALARLASFGAARDLGTPILALARLEKRWLFFGAAQNLGAGAFGKVLASKVPRKVLTRALGKALASFGATRDLGA
jgi:hypothetical protein